MGNKITLAESFALSVYIYLAESHITRPGIKYGGKQALSDTIFPPSHLQSGKVTVAVFLLTVSPPLTTILEIEPRALSVQDNGTSTKSQQPGP